MHDEDNERWQEDVNWQLNIGAFQPEVDAVGNLTIHDVADADRFTDAGDRHRNDDGPPGSGPYTEPKSLSVYPIVAVGLALLFEFAVTAGWIQQAATVPGCISRWIQCSRH